MTTATENMWDQRNLTLAYTAGDEIPDDQVEWLIGDTQFRNGPWTDLMLLVSDNRVLPYPPLIQAYAETKLHWQDLPHDVDNVDRSQGHVVGTFGPP